MGVSNTVISRKTLQGASESAILDAEVNENEEAKKSDKKDNK